MTGAQVRQADMPKAETGEGHERQEQLAEEETKEELKDLIEDYLQYLSHKQELVMEHDQQVTVDAAKASDFVQEMAPFDILEQKQQIRESFNAWL